MLTSDHSITHFEHGRALPDRLTQRRHGHYVDYADKMLSIYRGGIGRQRRQLHRNVEAVFADEGNCPSRRVRAFCKLLDDQSTYQTDPHGSAARLRLNVFALAAPAHPLVEQADRLFESEHTAVKQNIAIRIGRPWSDIERELYADVCAFQQLVAFEGYLDARTLLSRYNVAQLQACLYHARSMVVTATVDLKTILRYAKLAHLVHEIRRVGPSRYLIDLAGPASVLHETRRYGVNLARFVPALLACRGWRFEATIQTPWNTTARLNLSKRDGLRSHLPPPDEFDSHLEETFAEKFGDQREGWRLERETEIVHDGQTVFVPDFVFRHDCGVQVLFEIVGFWTPQYLAKKRQILQRFRRDHVLLAVPQRSLSDAGSINENVIVYKTSIKIAPVMAALRRRLEQHGVS